MAEKPVRSWPRRLGRIALWVGGALLLAALALIASIPIAGIGSEERLNDITNETIPGTAGGPDVRAWVAYPPARLTPEGTPVKRPVVVMIHEFWGLNESIVSKANLLATEGYVVIAPDVMRGSTTQWVPRAIYQVATTPPEQINADLDSVMAWARSQPDIDAERIAIVGFCFGGRTSMLYSLHDPTLEGTVVFYGNPPLDAARLAALEGPVLGIFGGADVSIPLEDVAAFEAALDEAGVENTVTVYPDQPHAFVTSAEGIATDPVQREAWNEMVGFLGSALASPTAGAARSQPADDPLGWAYLARLAWSHAAPGAHAGH